MTRKPTSSRGGARRSAAGAVANTGDRQLTVRVKTAKKRSKSSAAWLQRQLNDPYVAEAKARGLRSRAAFKIIELDDRFGFLVPGARVVDLGAAPGGWTQVAVDRVNAGKPGGGRVVGLDILEWESVPGATCITKDFNDDDAPAVLKAALGGPADVVLSDMAAPTTGHPATDHLRIMNLLELAWHFAEDVLAPGGTFVCKVFQGGTENELLARMKATCETVRHAKPPASRKDSAEMYVIASGFKGRPADRDDDDQEETA
ncbi:RlmE family RNA methyltransferase [Caenispirillum bisanense]|uniref:Ribosomal RNA large subunit methyltransferase E n=1 Tax=Caenispirillum bisanense TaxID=414052 RepID=A0A286GWR0_9PROT|nr:RlmE family RNA methyltransferase [Caenispirillum bisanense]SOD99933.1 23S rRNA Um-2552 2'-O-methyltransferase [Caenispirillum bisanense]